MLAPRNAGVIDDATMAGSGYHKNYMESLTWFVMTFDTVDRIDSAMCNAMGITSICPMIERGTDTVDDTFDHNSEHDILYQRYLGFRVGNVTTLMGTLQWPYRLSIVTTIFGDGIRQMLADMAQSGLYITLFTPAYIGVQNGLRTFDRRVLLLNNSFVSCDLLKPAEELFNISINTIRSYIDQLDSCSFSDPSTWYPLVGITSTLGVNEYYVSNILHRLRETLYHVTHGVDSSASFTRGVTSLKVKKMVPIFDMMRPYDPQVGRVMVSTVELRERGISCQTELGGPLPELIPLNYSTLYSMMRYMRDGACILVPDALFCSEEYEQENLFGCGGNSDHDESLV
jgi:hypothetical protein